MIAKAKITQQEAVLVLDDDGRVIEMNHKMERILGFPINQLLGKKVEIYPTFQARYYRKDSLTGLPDRMAFEEALFQAYHLCEKGDQLAALLYMDLDKFKVINDQWGHPIGDQVLNQVVDRMKVCVRPTDLLARLGGDEFGVILNKIQSLKNIETIASRFCKSLVKPVKINKQYFDLSVSIGIVSLPTVVPFTDVVLYADRAMYEVKKAGGNGWKYYAT